MKKLLFFFLSIISLSFATDEFVKGLIDVARTIING